MNKLLSSATAAFVILAGVSLGASPASADITEECTPSEAWTEVVVVTPAVPATPGTPAVPEVPEVSHDEFQRYSWTGGPIDEAPAEVPPSENWQPNTTNYDGAGHGTDPIGVAFQMDNPGNGNADWFFWTKTTVIDQPYVPGVPEIPGTPEIPAVTQTIEHPAVTCPPPVVSTANLTLTYVPACPPDDTNTWRVTNAAAFAVEFTIAYGGVGTVYSGSVPANADVVVNLPRTSATATLAWGGTSELAAGRTDVASGADLAADDSACRSAEPAVVQSVPLSPPPAAAPAPVVAQSDLRVVTRTVPAPAPTSYLAATGAPDTLPFALGGIALLLAAAAVALMRRAHRV